MFWIRGISTRFHSYNNVSFSDTKTFSPLAGGCSEGLDAFRFFLQDCSSVLHFLYTSFMLTTGSQSLLQPTSISYKSSTKQYVLLIAYKVE